MTDHTHEVFDYASPTPATNADDLPAEILDRAITVLHGIMIAGGVFENWKMQKLDSDGTTEVEELPTYVKWSNNGGNEVLKATLTRDGSGYVTAILYEFAPDGSTFGTIKQADVTRGTNGGVKNIDWSDP